MRPAVSTLALFFALAPDPARAQPDTVTVRWTAPGDDQRIGRATAYDMRSSTAPINEGNFSSADPVNGLPAPLSAGASQQVVVRGLVFGTRYYFAIKAVDDAGNWSGISNVVIWDWVYDTAPPAAPRGGSATRETSGIRVRWLANTEIDLVGYHVYRATAASGPYTRLTSSAISATDLLDTGVASDVPNAWYQVTAVDVSRNESARSTTFSLSVTVSGEGLGIEGGYPNPSHGGETVRIPIVLSTVGIGTAVVDVVDAAGRRVRRIDLAALPPGRQEVVWDGRNDAGRETVPGAYRAWIIAGGTRKSVGLLRVP